MSGELPQPGEETQPIEPAETTDGEAAEKPLRSSWKNRLRRGLKEHEGVREEEDGKPISSERFKIVRELGRGGMGVVLEAEDTVLDRKVALKVLLAGEFARPEALERFQIEARAAARLRHPNIVGLHEVGQDEKGRHYLVMDLIEGESLSARIARDGPLSSRETAHIARAIGKALQFAHSRSILHRDVKPANVLLGPEGEPVLTDFGLAKDLDSKSEGPTASGHILGTASYLPPELAEGQHERLDRRADVYAMGALIYHCLVGEPPFVASTVPQILAAVVGEEPVPPSRRRPEVSRDLETICLRCLEKVPGDRYDSAGELVDDLDRYLRDVPILTRPPTLLHRGKKWVRRNRGVARTLAGSAALGLLVSIIGTVVFVGRLRAEQARSELAAKEAKAALEVVVHDVRGLLADLPGEEIREAREEILTKSAQQLLRLQELEERGDPLAPEAYLQIGELAYEGGDIAQARLAYEQGIALGRELVARDRTRANLIQLARLLGYLASSHVHNGDRAYGQRLYAEALALANEAGATHPEAKLVIALASRGMGVIAQGEGKLTQAIERYEAGAELCRTLLDQPDMSTRARFTLLGHLELLGEAFRLLGRSDDVARTLAERIDVTRALLSERAFSWKLRRELSGALSDQGRLLQTKGELESALAHYRESVVDLRPLTQLDPRNVTLAGQLIATLQRMASILWVQGKADEALRLLEESEGRCRGLLKQSPDSRSHKRLLAESLTHLGDIRQSRGSLDSALASFLEAKSLRSELVEADPETLHGHIALCYVLGKLADLRDRQGDVALALSTYEEVLVRVRRALAMSPEDATLLENLAAALGSVGNLRAARGDAAEALKAHEEAIEIQRRFCKLDPSNASAARGLFVALKKTVKFHEDKNDLGKAQTLSAEGVEIMRGLVKLDAGNVAFTHDLAAALAMHANVVMRRKDLDTAQKEFEEARSLALELWKADDTSVATCQLLLSTVAGLGEIMTTRQDWPGARQLRERGLELARRRAELEPESSKALVEVCNATTRLIHIQRAIGELEAAGQTSAENVAAARRLSNLDSGREAFQCLIVALQMEGSVQEALGDPAAALRAYDDMVACAQKRLKDTPSSALARRSVSAGLITGGELQRGRGELVEGAAKVRRAVENHRILAKEHPQYAPELAQYERVLKYRERMVDIVAGKLEPETPNDHINLAKAQHRQARHPEAVESYREGFKNPRNKAGSNLYDAACSAALAATAAADAEEKKALEEQALSWLGEYLDQRRPVLLQIEAALKAAPEADRKRLLGVQKNWVGEFERAKTEPDFEALREDPGFKKLYAN